MPPNRKHLLATPERLRVHVLAARTRSAYSQLAVTGRVNHVLGHAVLTLPSCLVSASRLPLVHLALALPLTKLPRGIESDIRAAVGTQHDSTPPTTFPNATPPNPPPPSLPRFQDGSTPVREQRLSKS